MKKKKGLLRKMLVFIGIPVAVIFCITAAIVLNNVRQSVTQLTNKQLTAESRSASYQVNNYFSKYIEIAKQLAANAQLEDAFLKTAQGGRLTSVENYSVIKRSLDNIKQTDPDNIVVAWIADVDSSQFTRSDGAVSTADWKISERSWYKEMLEKQTVILTEPYLEAAGKTLIVSVVAPVYQQGTKNLIGIAALNISLDHLYSMVQNYKLGNTGFYILTTGSGQLVYYPDKNLMNKNVTESGMSKNIISAIQNKTGGAITYTAFNNTNYGYISPVGDTGWTIAAGLPEKEFNSAYDEAQASVFVVFILSLLILAALLVLVSRSIVNPLKKLTVAAGKIADGDLDVDVSIQSSDETGLVADAISRTVDRLKQYIQYIDEVSSVLDQIAVGNLVFDLHCDYVGEFSKIKTSLENIKYTLVRTFESITTSAEQVASGSDQVASASQALAQGATEQASAIQQLSASINEISNQVRQTADNATDASRLSSEAAVELQRGNEHMQSLMEAMAEMSKSSNEISKIIKTIQDIAFQTNILALNAAVEAARAGAAGKGFAVVADEVRNLASKSAEAAENTTILIENTVNSVQKGTKIADETAQSLTAIYESAYKSTQLVNEISDASREQSASISEVTTGIDQISAVVQTNSATSEESAASSEELNGQAQSLKTLVSKFKLKSASDAPATGYTPTPGSPEKY